MITIFANPKGGVGKSLLSFNFAVYEQLKNKDVTIIDLDAQHSILKFQGLRNLNPSNAPLNIKVFNESEKLLEFLDNNADKEELEIIIDSGGFDSEFNRYCLAYADRIIVPVSDSSVELMRLVDFNGILQEIENELRKTSVDKRIIGNVLFNRVHPSLRNTNEIVTSFEDMSNLRFLNFMVRDRARIKGSVASGISVLEETNRDERAVNDLELAFREIENIIPA